MVFKGGHSRLGLSYFNSIYISPYLIYNHYRKYNIGQIFGFNYYNEYKIGKYNFSHSSSYNKTSFCEDVGVLER